MFLPSFILSVGTEAESAANEPLVRFRPAAKTIVGGGSQPIVL